MRVRTFEQTPECQPIADPAGWAAANAAVIDNLLGLFGSIETAVGLAANQCEEEGEAIRHRFFVMSLAGKREVCLNPRIDRRHGQAMVMAERCLSWPGEDLRARRHLKVDASYTARDGTPVSCQLSGLEAQVFQHELDHLDGVPSVRAKDFAERVTPEPGRNDPCPCGSGKKYKKCCLRHP